MNARAADKSKGAYFLPARLGVGTLKNNGDAAAHRGDWDCALGLWSAALELKNQDAPLWHRLGVGLQHVGWAEKAMGCYEQALAIEPLMTEARCGLVGILEERGQLAEALGVLEEGVALLPGSVILRKWLARSLEDAGQPAHALEHWEVCAKLSDMPEEVWQARTRAAALRQKLPNQRPADNPPAFGLRLAQ